MQIDAYAALEAKATLEPFTYEADDLDNYGAEVKISHCGVCHSDLHLVDNDWRWSKYPLIPGHEIVGEVTAVGTLADPSLVGKRVGIGWQRSSCLQCEWCITGQEELCADMVNTTGNNYGGFAQKIIVDSRFVHVIPDALSNDNAAPLLCAGVTVYSPLVRYATSRSRVGIVGIGGLGHLGLQFANKMGCHVTAFSRGDAKRDESLELGAHEFVNTNDSNAMKKARGSLDVIIATVPANIDWTPYLRTLRPNAILVSAGAASGTSEIHLGRLGNNQAIAGTSIGGRQMMRDMLDFAARTNVRTWTEVLPFDSVNTALDRLRDNDVRYRFVLEN